MGARARPANAILRRSDEVTSRGTSRVDAERARRGLTNRVTEGPSPPADMPAGCERVLLAPRLIAECSNRLASDCVFAGAYGIQDLRARAVLTMTFAQQGWLRASPARRPRRGAS